MYRENPSLFGEAVNGFIQVLDFARKNDSRLVYASSSSIYGGLKPPHREGMQIKVNDLYAEAKLAMERIASLYSDRYGIGSVGLRLFSVYGPNEKAKAGYANLVSQFMWDLQAGKSPVIYGDGSQTRDYIYVNDVVRACLIAMEEDGSYIINVGTGISTTANQLIDLLNRLLGTNIKPSYVESPISNYVSHTRADTTKSKDLLGFEAEYSLEQGISKLLEKS
jgi:UDP-glucose 4-epimerase